MTELLLTSLDGEEDDCVSTLLAVPAESLRDAFVGASYTAMKQGALMDFIDQLREHVNPPRPAGSSGDAAPESHTGGGGWMGAGCNTRM